MYCVIQEIETKKKVKGKPKEIKTCETTFTIRGRTETVYGYQYSSELFVRPVRKAYRITVHESHRVDGKVTKKQTYICTIGYYDIVDWGGYIMDYMAPDRKEKILESLGIDVDSLCELVYAKLQPVIDQVKEEYAQTEEYKVTEEHHRIVSEYREAMEQFAEKYQVDRDEYKCCYDIFGVLRNKEYLEKIRREYKARRKYEQQSRSYYENFYSNYTESNTYTASAGNEDNKAVLKQFYRELSKKFHPDANPDIDTSEQMKVLNQLKSEWGV